MVLFDTTVHSKEISLALKIHVILLKLAMLYLIIVQKLVSFEKFITCVYVNIFLYTTSI